MHKLRNISYASGNQDTIHMAHWRVKLFIGVIAGVFLNSLTIAQTPTPTLPSQNNLVLWLRADSIKGLADKQALSIWVDSSPRKNDAAQSQPDKQPLYVSNIQNGLPVVRFVGGDTPQGLLTPSVISLESASIFLVVRSKNFASSYVLSLGDDRHAVVARYAFHEWSWFEGAESGSFVKLGRELPDQFQIVSFTAANSVHNPWAIDNDRGCTTAFSGGYCENSRLRWFPILGGLRESNGLSCGQMDGSIE